MASTYLSLHYHLVFATKNRENVIVPGQLVLRDSVRRAPVPAAPAAQKRKAS